MSQSGPTDQNWVKRDRLWNRIFIIYKRGRKANVTTMLFLVLKDCMILSGQARKQQGKFNASEAAR